jgi:hypothetical protein
MPRTGRPVSAATASGGGQGPVRFSAPVILNAGDPAGVAGVDLNGDGKADLATADWGTSTVSVRLGKGDGSFGRRRAYRSERHPIDLTVADLDGDGHPDLVSHNLAGSITVFLNRGAGRLQRGGAYSAGGRGDKVAAADVNRDGTIDLLAAHDSRTDLSVLVGRGAGRFSPAHSYTGLPATDMAVADLNADGSVDVALGTDADSVVVRLGRGDGTLGPAQAYKAAPKPFGVTVADLNHDDKLDIVAGNYAGRSASVLVGAGDGTFGAASRYSMGGVDTIIVADFDGDGNLDFATSSASIVVRRGAGDGTFLTRQTAFRYPYPLITVGGAIADFNADGRPDLAFGNECDPVEEAGCRPKTAWVFLNWTGQPAPPCVVPDIGYWTIRAATRQIGLAGCRLRHVRYRYSRSVPKNRVIAQRPTYGSVLPSHSAVSVSVSRGRRRYPSVAAGKVRPRQKLRVTRLIAEGFTDPRCRWGARAYSRLSGCSPPGLSRRIEDPRDGRRAAGQGSRVARYRNARRAASPRPPSEPERRADRHHGRAARAMASMISALSMPWR